MQLKHILLGSVLLVTSAAASAHAGGSAEAWWRECRVCHQVAAPDGTVLAFGGRGAPNLYGIAGRPAGEDRDFRRYSEAMRVAARNGLIWTRDNFVAYVQDPDGFLKNLSGVAGTRSKMTVPAATDARALYEFLNNLTP